MADYIMQLIENLSNFLGKVLFQKQTETIDVIDETTGFSSGNFLIYRLKKMIREGKINEAEDLLFEELEYDKSPDMLKAALSFYSDLKELTEEELQRSDYSREEIYEGLSEIKKRFALDADADSE